MLSIVRLDYSSYCHSSSFRSDLKKHYVFYFQKQAREIQHSYTIHAEGVQKPVKSVIYRE